MRRRLLLNINTGPQTRTLTLNSCHPSGATIYVNGVAASVGDTFTFNDGDRVTITATKTDWPDYSKTFVITENMSYDIEMASSIFGFTNVGNSAVYVRLIGFGVSDATSLTDWEYSFNQGDTWTDAQYDVNNDMVHFANDYTTGAGIQPGQTMLVRHKTPIFTSYEANLVQRHMEFDFMGSGSINVSGRLSEMCRLTELTPSSGYNQKGFGGLFYSQNCLDDCSGFILDVDFSQISCSPISSGVGYGGYQSMFANSYVVKCPTIEAPLTVPQYGFENLFANCDSRPAIEFTCYSLDISASHALRGMFSPITNWTTDGTFYCPQSMINTWPDATYQNDYYGGIPPTWRRVALVQYVTIKSCNIAGASITVNGSPVNVGDVLTYSFNDTVTVTATKAGYATYSETFTIKKEDIFVNINLVELPTWCECNGVVVAPGPMYYSSSTGKYSICNTFNEYCSYGQTAGDPKTYFSHLDVGEKFDSSGSQFYTNVQNTSGNHTIDNQGTLVTDQLGVYNDWRLPSANELQIILFGGIYDTQSGSFTQVRNGSTVNNTSNVYAAYIKVSGQTVGYAVNGLVNGILVFPDDQVITGTNVLSASGYYTSATNGSTHSSFQTSSGSPTTLTPNQLEAYIEQGCTFIPEGGYSFVDTSSIVSWVNSSSSNQITNLMPTTYFVTNSVANQEWGGKMLMHEYSGVYIEDLTTYNAPGGDWHYATKPCQIYLVRGSMDLSALNYMVIANMMGTYYYVSSKGVGLDFSDLTNNPPTLYNTSVSDANKYSVSSWSEPSSSVYRATLSDGHYFDITDYGSGSYGISYT